MLNSTLSKKEAYKRIRIAGLISYMPIVLCSAPFGGYFLGGYLKDKFDLPLYTVYIFTAIGFLAGIREIVRILRLVIRIDKS